LNEQFRKLIKYEEFNNSHLIKDVVLINVDTFIGLQDLFKNQTLKLSHCIEQYLSYINRGNALNKIYPFDKFLKGLANKAGWKGKATDEFNSIIESLK